MFETECKEIDLMSSLLTTCTWSSQLTNSLCILFQNTIQVRIRTKIAEDTYAAQFFLQKYIKTCIFH
jgi:hypothetical protein